MRRCLFAVLVAVTGCGDGDSGDARKAGPDTLTVALDLQSMVFTPGTTQSTTVHITRTGQLVGGVTSLSVDGAPAGVTMAFDNSAPVTDSAQLTFVVAADAVQADAAPVTVTAQQNGLSATAQADIGVGPPSSVTVHVTFASSVGWPSSGATIEPWSAAATQPQVGIVGEDGTVDIAGMTTPYDAVVRYLGYTVVYLGLTRTDPTVMVDNVLEATDDPGASVVVTFTGAADNSSHAVSVTCAHTWGTNTDVGDVSVFLAGAIDAGETCAVKAVEFKQKADGMPTEFGYGEATVQLSAGAYNVPVAVPITSYVGLGTSVQLTIPLAPDDGCYVVNQSFVFGAGLGAATGADNCTKGDTQVAAAAPPLAAGIPMTITLTDVSGNWWTQTLTNDATQTIDFPGVPALTAPEADATDVTPDTTFSFSGLTPNSIGIFDFYDGVTSDDDGDRGDVWTTIYTTQNTVRFSDLARLGVRLDWYVSNYGWDARIFYGVSTVDDVATLITTDTGQGGAANQGQGQTAIRYFTID